MKKLKLTIPNGGAPLGQFPVLRELFDQENKNAIEALLFSITEGQTKGVILKGCQTTNTGATYSISSGYVYLDGEVLFFAGATGLSGERFIKKAAVTEQGGTFADGSFKNYIDVNVADLATSAPVTGQYVNLNDGVEGQTLNNVILKVRTSVFTGDLDDLLKAQSTLVSGPTNQPVGFLNPGTLLVFGIEGVRVVQQLTSVVDARIYIRQKIGSNAFSSWVSNTP